MVGRRANVAVPTARRGESRAAIVDAGERLFPDHGFGRVSMDDLAGATGVARRTILREMLRRVSDQLEGALPPGIETRADVEDVLRLVARAILELHGRPGYLGLLRTVVADSGQRPWIVEALVTVMEPQAERFARYLTHQTAMGILDCRNPMLAARQFLGTLNEVHLWPWMMGRASVPAPPAEVVDEAIRMFLGRYGSHGRRRQS